MYIPTIQPQQPQQPTIIYLQPPPQPQQTQPQPISTEHKHHKHHHHHHKHKYNDKTTPEIVKNQVTLKPEVIEPLPTILNSNNESLNKIYNKLANQLPDCEEISDIDIRILLSIDYISYIIPLLESNNNMIILITFIIIKRLHISFNCIYKLLLFIIE